MRTCPLMHLIVIMMVLPAGSQVTLDSCCRKAREHHPLIRQLDLIRQSEAYTLSNADRGYLPQLNITAKATYQSDVTRVNIAGSPALQAMISNLSLPSPGKDQYQAAAELSQILWDGGAISVQKKAVKAASEAEEKKIEVDLYAINERVQQLFFGILLIEQQLRQNEILQNEFEINYNRVSAYMANGVASQADLDAVKVEQLGCAQRRIELLALGRAYRAMLAMFIGESIQENATFIKPAAPDLPVSAGVKRPEAGLFDSQIRALDNQIDAINAGVLPKLGLFIQGGYGQPGLNMLEDEFRAYYLGGVRLTWNISGFYTRSSGIGKIHLEKGRIGTLRDAFLFTTACQAAQQTEEVDKYRKLMRHDDEIISLRTNIKKAAEAKVENGTLAVSDLLREIHAENLVRQALALHEIQWLQSIYTLKNTLND